MTTFRLPTLAACVTACALAAAAGVALAQPTGPLAAPERPASGASAAPAASAPLTGPRLRTPAETANRATVPGELRPERPVTPQISIPFGKSPPPPGKREEGVITRPVPPSGGVDDAAARCESQVDDRVRATCRAKLARESKGRLPN